MLCIITLKYDTIVTFTDQKNVKKNVTLSKGTEIVAIKIHNDLYRVVYVMPDAARKVYIHRLEIYEDNIQPYFYNALPSVENDVHNTKEPEGGKGIDIEKIRKSLEDTKSIDDFLKLI